jgi:threonine dehydrogenase-like Zn-dependent dehydrogenase
MYGAGDVRVENVPDAALVESTDALLRVTRACICGSDLWPYNQMEHTETGRRMGHEFIGVVEAVGSDVRNVKPGDVVVCADRARDRSARRGSRPPTVSVRSTTFRTGTGR